MARNSGMSLKDPMDEHVRKLVYLDYGEFMTSLCGCYITAEDIGTTLKDMETIYSKTRFTTCIPAELGSFNFIIFRRFWNSSDSHCPWRFSWIRSSV